MPRRPGGGGYLYGLFQALREATSAAQLSGLLRAHPASPCNQLAQGHLCQLKQQPQASGLWDGGGGWGWHVTLWRCGGSGVCVYFLFRYGNPVESACGFFFLLSTWMGGVGEAGDSPQPQFSVEDMWRVFVECVVDGWFTASPGLSQTDWTLAGWGCTPVVHESNHGTQDKPAINTHTRGGATGMAVVPLARQIPPA